MNLMMCVQRPPRALYAVPIAGALRVPRTQLVLQLLLFWERSARVCVRVRVRVRVRVYLVAVCLCIIVVALFSTAQRNYCKNTRVLVDAYVLSTVVLQSHWLIVINNRRAYCKNTRVLVDAYVLSTVVLQSH